jgi:hypothetical protein
MYVRLSSLTKAVAVCLSLFVAQPNLHESGSKPAAQARDRWIPPLPLLALRAPNLTFIEG